MKIMLLLVVTALGLGVLADRARVGASPMPSAQSIEQLTGSVVGWRLDMDGRLYVELQGVAAEEGSMRMWFELPAERSAFQGVHAMALDVILLHYQASDAYPLTVIAKRERSLDGSSPEEAVPVLAFASP